jgi:hypothetical protein
MTVILLGDFSDSGMTAQIVIHYRSPLVYDTLKSRTTVYKSINQSSFLRGQLEKRVKKQRAVRLLVARE